MPENVYEFLEQSANQWPQHPALVDEHGTLDYQRLYEAVDAATFRLLELGVSAGQRIGLMARNGRSFIIGAFAIFRCGAVLAPIPHQFKKAEFDALICSLPLASVLHDSSGVHALKTASYAHVDIAGAPALRLARLENAATEPVSYHPEHPAYIRFTSGTTGKEKGVIITHKSLIKRAAATNRALRLSNEDTVVWVLPMTFHFCASILLYLSVGATIAMCPDHLAESIIEVANRHRGTFLYASPLHYRLLAAAPSGVPFSTLRRAVSTLATLPVQTARLFLDRHDIPISQAYGIIEVGLPAINLDRAIDRPDSIGRPLPDYDIALLDEDCQPVPPGTVGQVAVRGPGMFAGYLNPPQPAPEILRDGWFFTGDLARMDTEGLLTLAGRCKSVINVSGNKVFPEEVEEVLNRHPLVLEAKVSADPHPQLGEVVRAQVALRNPTRRPDVEELLALCRKQLSSYKVPHSVVFVDRIDHTPSGKILRHEPMKMKK
jgi:acyl-CoA synthetase (AMP-forming)/AMP-acid ligase II